MSSHEDQPIFSVLTLLCTALTFLILLVISDSPNTPERKPHEVTLPSAQQESSEPL